MGTKARAEGTRRAPDEQWPTATKWHRSFSGHDGSGTRGHQTVTCRTAANRDKGGTGAPADTKARAPAGTVRLRSEKATQHKGCQRAPTGTAWAGLPNPKSTIQDQGHQRAPEGTRGHQTGTMDRVWGLSSPKATIRSTVPKDIREEPFNG